MERAPGFKMTPQRLAILDYLSGNTGHPSAEDIYANISKKFPTISLSTVYNTLEALGQRGMIAELTLDSRRRRFDPDMRPHHHLFCIKCSKVIDIHARYELLVPETARRGFEIMGNRIQFYGICEDCHKSATTKKQRRRRA